MFNPGKKDWGWVVRRSLALAGVAPSRPMRINKKPIANHNVSGADDVCACKLGQ